MRMMIAVSFSPYSRSTCRDKNGSDWREKWGRRWRDRGGVGVVDEMREDESEGEGRWWVCLFVDKERRKGKGRGGLLMMRAEEGGGDFTEDETALPCKRNNHTQTTKPDEETYLSV
jgi:hypothetical protein